MGFPVIKEARLPTLSFLQQLQFIIREGKVTEESVQLWKILAHFDVTVGCYCKGHSDTEFSGKGGKGNNIRIYTVPSTSKSP